MRELAERTYFYLCLVLGWLLRSARYSKVRIVYENGEPQVRKHRRFYAPLLVRLGRPLLKFLDTGVQILPRQEWEEREYRLYQNLYGLVIQIDKDGTLILPYIKGETLAEILDHPLVEASVRKRSIERVVAALADFHHMGFTHGDAMAENVLVENESGIARWFDFETMHDSSRSVNWQRANDLRALLVTCLARTTPEAFAETCHLILDRYPDKNVTHLLATDFFSIRQRPLLFHLAQAGLPYHSYRKIGRLLGAQYPYVSA